MKLQLGRMCLAFLLVPLALCDLSSAAGMQANEINVSLKINPQFEQDAIVAGIDFGSASAEAPNFRSGRAPGGVLVGIEQVKDPQHAYTIKVDSNADGDLTNDQGQLIQPNSSVKVMIRRTWGQKENLLPYTIDYSREQDQQGNFREKFYWRPGYRAEGELRIGQCRAILVVLDLNGDGVFDAQDSERGTTIGLDRDGDGRVWGKDEWLHGKQIIEYCGSSMLIDRLEQDGSALRLVRTDLKVPKVGDQLPSVSLSTVEGKPIRIEQLRGRVIVFDFWASWCKICVAQFGRLQEIQKKFSGKIEVISINVDEPSRLQQARQIIRQYELAWPHVMSGKGAADPVWKTFGGMAGNRLGIPLYVLADQTGRLRYAGPGGEKLSELRAGIEGLLQGETSDTKR